jgi:Flp pilus assembly protein TadB
MVRKTSKDLLSNWHARIERAMRTESQKNDYSSEYRSFKKEALRKYTGYEKACKTFGKFLRIKVGSKDREKTERALKTAHIEVEPEEAAGLALFSLLFLFMITLLISAAIYLMTNEFPILVFFLLIFASFFSYFYLSGMPKKIEQKWRLKASSQMVPCILYIVIYMRHTSNLERAVRFASQHLQPPLSLDLKKVFWDVETGHFSTIKEALDAYLETWREHNLEFVESFHLIESSLFEPSESRRIQILEKSLDVMLEGIYEKMLHYTHDIRAPITNIYMLGIVLPTLGLALLPLASTLLQGAINWIHVLLLFNIIIPFFVFYMTSQLLSKRPGGFGETHLLERNPNYATYKDKSHYVKALFIVLPLFLIGIFPLLVPVIGPSLGINDVTFGELGINFLREQKIFGYIDDNGTLVGPFGLISLLMSLFVPLSVALFFSLSYKFKTQNLIDSRIETKKLEKQFSSSLFQLGNRLGDNIPAEMAFGRVAQSIKGTPTAGFFTIVNTNIQQAGMSVEDAIFNKSRGAINYYPSDLVRTSMEILVESVKKGLQVGARALMSISQYVKNIHKVNERLKDLLADIISEMRSNMSFLAPLLAAIVIGLASMITLILGNLESLKQ